MFLRTDREFRNSQFTNIGPFPFMKCSKDNLSDQAIFVHWLERSLFGENITIATQLKSSQEEPQIRMPAIVLSSHCLQRVMPLLTIRTGTKRRGPIADFRFSVTGKVGPPPGYVASYGQNWNKNPRVIDRRFLRSRNRKFRSTAGYTQSSL